MSLHERRVQQLLFCVRVGLETGNFKHAPNADAVRWLKASIWPLIRAEMPQGASLRCDSVRCSCLHLTRRVCCCGGVSAEVHLYGSYANHVDRQLSDRKSGFVVHGYVHDAAEALKRYVAAVLAALLWLRVIAALRVLLQASRSARSASLWCRCEGQGEAIALAYLLVSFPCILTAPLVSISPVFASCRLPTAG